MVDVSQWRAVIGQWNNRCSTCHVSTNTVKGSGNVSDSTGGGAGPTVFVIILVLAGLLVMLSGDVELNPGPWPDVTHKAVYDLLVGKASKWNEIGQALNVPYDFRKGLRRLEDDTYKLEDVINEWIQSECSEVSWDYLITVLRSEQLKMAALAKKVEDYLSKHEAIDNPPPEHLNSSRSPESSCTRVSPPVQDEASSSITQVTHQQMEEYRYGHSLRETHEKLNIQCSESFSLLTFPHAHVSELPGHFSQSNTQQQIPKQYYSSNRSFKPQTIVPVLAPNIRPVSSPNVDHSLHGIQVLPQLKYEFHNPQCHVDCDADSGIERYKQDLIAMYKKKKPSYLKTPSPFLKYINLSLVQSKKVDKAATIEINDILLCKSTDIKFPILIKGDPGVGKTTLAWELCVRWATAEEESLLRKKWKIVKFIQLRAKEVREAEKVDKLLDPYQEYDEFRYYIMKAKSAGKDMLLIFDGFDELSHEQQMESSLVMRLLEGVTLSQASIIITSRPAAVQYLPERFNNLDQYIEVKGFRDEDIQDYIKCKFESNKDVLDAFNDYISSHEFIFTLMYVPLHCALVTELYEESYQRDKMKFEPKTLTQLYTYFIHCLIQRNTGIRVDDIAELPHNLKDKFEELARIAAEGITHRQYVFDIGIDDEFGMLQKVYSSRKCGTVQSVSCSFSHLTLQEYLAAYHWSTNAPPLEVAGLFKTNGALPIKKYFMTEGRMRSSSSKGNNYIHWPALHFYSGLTGVVKTPLEEEVTKHKLIKNEGQNSNKFNIFCLLFESQNPTLVSLVIPRLMAYEIRSANEAYVTGYCIARAMESVKWEIEMKHMFMKNLVDGIKHANSSKGSFIHQLKIYEQSSDCDISKYFDYIEQISAFVKDLYLEYIYYTNDSVINNKARIVKPNWSFSLAKFSIDILCYYTIEPRELNDFVQSLFNTLTYVKTLKMALFRGIPFIHSTIDGEGIVCISFVDHKQCFRNFSLSSIPQLPQNYFAIGLIPYAVVRNTNKRYHGFGFLKYGYDLLNMMNDIIIFPALHHIVKSVYSRRPLIPSYHDIIDGFDIILFDVNHQFLLTEYYSIYFYNTETKKWAELKIAELRYGAGSAAGSIMMVVNEGNVELLRRNILKNVADKIHTLKLVGDSGELTKVARSLEDTNIEIKSINIALETAAEYEFDDRCLNYDYFKSSTNCVVKPQCLTRDARLSRCCFDTLFFTLKDKKSCSFPFSKFSIVSLSLTFKHNIREQLTDHDIDVFEAFSTKLLISNAASLKELKVNFISPRFGRDTTLIQLGKVACTILEENPLEVVMIYDIKSAYSATLYGTADINYVVKLLYAGLLNLTTLKVLIIEKCEMAFDELLKVISHLAVGNTHSVVVFDDCSFSSHQYRELLDKAISSTGSINEIYIREEELSTVEAIKELPLNIDANCRILLSHWPSKGTSKMNNKVSSQQINIINPRHFEEHVESLKIYRTDINDSYWERKQMIRSSEKQQNKKHQSESIDM